MVRGALIGPAGPLVIGANQVRVGDNEPLDNEMLRVNAKAIKAGMYKFEDECLNHRVQDIAFKRKFFGGVLMSYLNSQRNWT